MIRIRNIMIATTSKIWINEPNTCNPINPTSQSTMRMKAIVINIYIDLN